MSATRCAYGGTYPDRVKFAKGHGTQNDFVLLPDLDASLPLEPAAVTALCDRRQGIGADGVLRVTTAGAAAAAEVFDRLPEGVAADKWEQDKARALENNQDNYNFVQQAVYGGAYQAKDAAKRADALLRFAKTFPDSPYAMQAMGVAASSYQQAQNAPKMMEVANAILAKDPNNMGMLLLVSDYYGEKGEQLDKAEGYAQKAVTLAGSAQKPSDVPEDQWKQQTALQKGLALSTLGQINLQKKNNSGAMQNFQAAAPLLKTNDTSYARNQYRLGFALLNLKKIPEAKAAFTEAASVNSPYKSYAQDKLKALPATTAARKKPS